MNPRFYTNKLCNMIEDCVITDSRVVSMCLSYMSEDDVKDMMESNDLTEEEDDFLEECPLEWDEQIWKDARLEDPKRDWLTNPPVGYSEECEMLDDPDANNPNNLK